MLNFFKTHILYNNDGYNGFITILFTAILMMFFEVVFFMNIGLNDIKKSLDILKNKLKVNIDKKLLGNEKYCNYLYKTIKTDHSNKIFNKYCKDNYNNNNNNNELNEYILKLKQSSEINNILGIGKTASIIYGTDIKSQVENIESILRSITDMSDPDIIISSLYDYYREHPEFAKSGGVIKNILKDKYNNEINNNAWELIIIVITILSTIIFMFKICDDPNKKSEISIKRVLWNFAFVFFGIVAYQIYFYYNIALKYQYYGNNYLELIDYYKNI